MKPRASYPAVHPRGYTLTEMLVVLGIIVALIAILLPVLSKARAAVRQTACLSNMRQIGSAQLLYLADNQGCFPPTCLDGTPGPGTSYFADDGVWNGSYPNMLGCLKPYIGNNLKVFTCPEYYVAGSSVAGSVATNYLPNGAFSATRYPYSSAVSQGARLGSIRNSANIILCQEWFQFANACFPRPYLATNPDLKTYTGWHSGLLTLGYEQYTNIHSHGGNVTYADGHAEWRACTSMHAGDFGLTGGAGVTGSATDDNQQPYTNTYRRAK